MSSIFKRTYRDKKTGKQKKTATWYGQYTDSRGRPIRVKLSRNRAAAEKMLSELITKQEFLKAGLFDPYLEHQMALLYELLAEYRQHHLDRGNTERQADQVVTR